MLRSTTAVGGMLGFRICAPSVELPQKVPLLDRQQYHCPASSDAGRTAGDD
jgi:hypothetical protein